VRALLQLESSFLLFAAVRALGKTIDVVSIGRQFRKFWNMAVLNYPVFLFRMPKFGRKMQKAGIKGLI
jgi:hypothetical protein